MWAASQGFPYHAFEGIDDARQNPDATLVMEADTGGQILVTCPVRHIRASDAVLNQLLCDLERLVSGFDSLAESDQSYEAEMYYEVLPVGSGVAGGMGGGLVVDGVWVHRELVAMGLKDQIDAVIFGRRERLERRTERSIQ
jgi:hypothetical protein